jgi:hypothetical protein
MMTKADQDHLADVRRYAREMGNTSWWPKVAEMDDSTLLGAMGGLSSNSKSVTATRKLLNKTFGSPPRKTGQATENKTKTKSYIVRVTPLSE